jgi:PDZ domain-containing protein
MNAIRRRAAAACHRTADVLRALAVATLLLLAGCATGPGTMAPSTKPVPPETSGHYEIVPGREPALVADLRAAPPPAEPEIGDGKSVAADEQRLRAQSYMHIGTSHFPAADADARTKALRQGQQVGADRVIVYPAAGAGDLVVAYYVRFKLPFGATFRDLRPAEMSELGTGGGVAIGSVVDDSPASRANLLAGDIVLKCDDKAIIDRADFQSRLRAKAGRPVNLTIVRNGETLQRMVRLGPMSGS